MRKKKRDLDLSAFERSKLYSSQDILRRYPAEERVISGQKLSTEIIYIISQTSIGLF